MSSSKGNTHTTNAYTYFIKPQYIEDGPTPSERYSSLISTMTFPNNLLNYFFLDHILLCSSSWIQTQQSFCLSILSTEFIDTCYHTWPKKHFQKTMKNLFMKSAIKPLILQLGIWLKQNLRWEFLGFMVLKMSEEEMGVQSKPPCIQHHPEKGKGNLSRFLLK